MVAFVGDKTSIKHPSIVDNSHVGLPLLRRNAADDFVGSVNPNLNFAHFVGRDLFTGLTSCAPHRKEHFARALLPPDAACLEFRRGGDDVCQRLHSHVRVEVCAPVQANFLDGLDGLALFELREQLVGRLAAQLVLVQVQYLQFFLSADEVKHDEHVVVLGKPRLVAAEIYSL